MAADPGLGRPGAQLARAPATSTPPSTLSAAQAGGCRGARAWLWGTLALTAGAFAAAIVLAPPASASPVRGLIWLLFLGSSVHVAATAWLYTQADARAYALRRPLRYVWIPAGLILAGAVTAALLSPTAMAWILLPYFGWQFFHFQKQNLGMAALAASARSVSPLRPVERRALLAQGDPASSGWSPGPASSSSGCAPEPETSSPWPCCCLWGWSSAPIPGP